MDRRLDSPVLLPPSTALTAFHFIDSPVLPNFRSPPNTRDNEQLIVFMSKQAMFYFHSLLVVLLTALSNRPPSTYSALTDYRSVDSPVQQTDSRSGH